MLCNRVDPFGQLHAVPQRGQWFGNKGCLHTPDGRITRFHAGKRWITCLCAFRGRKRRLVQPGRYTELFFLDEATAYAAGHRPCAECRRADWVRFMAVWAKTFGPAKTDAVDAVLHDARLDGKSRRLTRACDGDIPNGAMILSDGKPILKGLDRWWRWQFDGYWTIDPPTGGVDVLTPEPIVILLGAGLPVQMALTPTPK